MSAPADLGGLLLPALLQQRLLLLSHVVDAVPGWLWRGAGWDPRRRGPAAVGSGAWTIRFSVSASSRCNANVRALSTKVEVRPSNVVASGAGITRAEYFEADDPAVRARPDVSLRRRTG